MTEKTKWFDPAPVSEPQLAIIAPSGCLFCDDAIDFLQAIQLLHRRRKLAEEPFRFFERLCRMPPAARLSRNFKIVLNLLTEHDICHVMQEGLTAEEKTCLMALEASQAPSKIRAVAQGLLGINERQQLVKSVQELYHNERSRKWDVPAAGS